MVHFDKGFQKCTGGFWRIQEGSYQNIGLGLNWYKLEYRFEVYMQVHIAGIVDNRRPVNHSRPCHQSS